MGSNSPPLSNGKHVYMNLSPHTPTEALKHLPVPFEHREFDSGSSSPGGPLSTEFFKSLLHGYLQKLRLPMDQDTLGAPSQKSSSPELADAKTSLLNMPCSASDSSPDLSLNKTEDDSFDAGKKYLWFSKLQKSIEWAYERLACRTNLAKPYLVEILCTSWYELIVFEYLCELGTRERAESVNRGAMLLREMRQKLESLCLDQVEVEMLRDLILFQPDNCCELHKQEVGAMFDQMQEEMQLKLSKYVADHYGKKEPTRFGRLLMWLSKFHGLRNEKSAICNLLMNCEPSSEFLYNQIREVCTSCEFQVARERMKRKAEVAEDRPESEKYQKMTTSPCVNPY
ncbi:hypothetical protein Ciccas_006735 [Cichlidogyrus casuarinus]|uniref:Uncharacterized protein n=1 Tax=Cichlidogyrus casuarinus TaxID=1844966 RepID=A0ABD2Q4W8_9PLAT